MGNTPSGYAGPPKGGAPCPGRSNPCPNNEPPSSMPSAPPASRRRGGPPLRRQPQDRPQVARPLRRRPRRRRWPTGRGGPGRSPGRTPEDVERAVLEARDRCGWGPRKLHAVLAAEGRPAPPPRTIAAILRRHGRARPRPGRARGAAAAAVRAAGAPTSSGSSTSRGRWRSTAAGSCRCRSSTTTAATCSALRPCTDMTFATVQAVLWDVFGDVGLPEALLCDNAFSGPEQRRRPVGLRRLADPPGHPADPRPALPPADAGQGRAVPRHARGRAVAARRGATAWSTSPPTWRRGGRCTTPCGRTRPCGDEPPVCRWRPSARRRPDRVPEASYPAGSVLRRVGQVGRRSATARRGSWWAGAWPASRSAWRSEAGRSRSTTAPTGSAACRPSELRRDTML